VIGGEPHILQASQIWKELNFRRSHKISMGNSLHGISDAFGPKLYKLFAIVYEAFFFKYLYIISNIKRSVGFVFSSCSIESSLNRLFPPAE
jgi:hypothetical protein